MSEAVTFTCDFCGMKEPALPADVAMSIPHSSVELVLRGGRLKPQGLQHPTPEEDGSERWTASLCDRCAKRFGALLDLRLLDPVEIERELRAQSLEAARYAETGSMHVPYGMRVPEPVVVRSGAEQGAPPAAQYPNVSNSVEPPQTTSDDGKDTSLIESLIEKSAEPTTPAKKPRSRRR